MFRTRLATVAAVSLLATPLFAQGLDTKATKDDWEEINFEFNSSILSDGYPTLLRLADLLKQHPDYRVKVEGHTDFVGSPAYNEKLALARASMVRDFLVKYGAGASQLQVSGQGKRIPEVPNTTKEGRFMNRRVVLTVTDGTGKIIAAGGAPEVVNTLDDRLKKLEDCCSQILKKLDKLDDILAAIRDLKNENDRLKADVDALKNRPQPQMPTIPPPPDVAKEVEKVLDERAVKNRKFALLGLNAGPTMAGDISVSGKGRFFGVFGETHAVQAEGEYMYYGGKTEGRQEGQFDLGLVNRFGNVQAGLFSSFKYVNMRQFQSGGTLGQGAFTLDYIFRRGRVGFFGTKGFRDNVPINRAQIGPFSFNETYLKIVDQYGGSGQVGLFGDSYIEGNLGYLKRRGGDDRPGGMIRFVQPVSRQIALTVEAGLNETLLSTNSSGRVVFGLQFGNWVRPKEYWDVKHPVPVDIPRLRYELLTRRVGNDAPVADAGPDQTVPPGSVRLDGSASYDPDGDPLTYQWTQIYGQAVSLTGANTATATFTAAEGQRYVFRLTVKDPAGLQSTARTTVTVTQNPQVRILRFVAQPNVIDPGQSSTLIWQVENADSVTISGIGNVDPRSGTSVVSPAQTTMYQLTAKNGNSTVNETVTVTVTRKDVNIVIFEATPATIMAGEASTLQWATENATRVEISGGIGAVSPNGKTSVTPAQTTTYTLTATGLNGSVTANATVQVVAGSVPRIIQFSATPPDILPGEQSKLSWQVENAATVTISGLGNVDATGSSSVTPSATTTYTLTATNKNGQVTAAAVVTIIPPVKILDFSADKTEVVSGSAVTLKWSTQNATDVVITGIGSVAVSGTMQVKPTQLATYTLLAYGRRSQASAVLIIKVTPPPPASTQRPPVADAGPDQSVYANTATLNGTKSYSPDGVAITYSWRFVSSTLAKSNANGPSAPAITGGTTATPTIAMPQQGTYIFELTVTDTRGLSSSAVTRVTFVDP